jgi:hypothetical protein
MSLFCDAFFCCLWAEAQAVVLHALSNLLSSSSRIYVHHKFLVCPRHNPYVLLHQERVVELASGFGVPMLDVSNLRVNSHLYPCIGHIVVDLFTGCSDEWRVGVDDGRGEVEDRADRDRVLESGWVERDEGRADV